MSLDPPSSIQAHHPGQYCLDSIEEQLAVQKGASAIATVLALNAHTTRKNFINSRGEKYHNQGCVMGTQLVEAGQCQEAPSQIRDYTQVPQTLLSGHSRSGMAFHLHAAYSPLGSGGVKVFALELPCQSPQADSLELLVVT
eukprot:g45486.t1